MAIRIFIRDLLSSVEDVPPEPDDEAADKEHHQDDGEDDNDHQPQGRHGFGDVAGILPPIDR
jgi:hypothetical protein